LIFTTEQSAHTPGYALAGCHRTSAFGGWGNPSQGLAQGLACWEPM
jgi:hypothetical protein